ncbi:ATP-binding protein [Sneathiella marina]|uniref:histidine kinase n=1 Tax=Sneathiella marina TaxID=2950108 RepID=A0ABY4W705_9PROT|nr:ATP-binding protein [Sneathiella marina]USG62952.1 ATP-binding protein [Sneathiella marina]
MSDNNGYFRKMILFIFIVAAPVAAFSVWLVNEGTLNYQNFFILILLVIFPSLALYIKLSQDLKAITKRIETVTNTGLQAERLGVAEVPYLLPADNLLLILQQYHRILRRMLEESRAAQQNTAFLFDKLPDPVLVLDSKRQIVQSNAAAARFFNTENISGDLTGFLRQPALLKAIEKAYKGETSDQNVEITLSDTVVRYVAAYVVNLRSEDAAELQLIVTLHDLTASRKLEQMRVDFVANASHELRTPLAILIGALETLMGPARDDLQAHQRFFDMMQKQSARMSQLTDDLLSLSQIEINEHSRPSEAVDIGQIICSVKNMIQMKAEGLRKNISLELPEQNMTVAGDADQLSQVFINLVDNALKYSSEEAEVKVRVSTGEKSVKVSVIDTGEGIDPEHLPRLTERFYRVNSDRSRELGGTGLGLAIVKHIVSRHRGNLEIESVLGKGSVFTIILPLLPSK